MRSADRAQKVLMAATGLRYGGRCIQRHQKLRSGADKERHERSSRHGDGTRRDTPATRQLSLAVTTVPSRCRPLTYDARFIVQRYGDPSGDDVAQRYGVRMIYGRCKTRRCARMQKTPMRRVPDAFTHSFRDAFDDGAQRSRRVLPDDDEPICGACDSA